MYRSNNHLIFFVHIIDAPIVPMKNGKWKFYNNFNYLAGRLLGVGTRQFYEILFNDSLLRKFSGGSGYNLSTHKGGLLSYLLSNKRIQYSVGVKFRHSHVSNEIVTCSMSAWKTRKVFSLGRYIHTYNISFCIKIHDTSRFLPSWLGRYYANGKSIIG